jgi:hypothetical protein
MPLGAVAPSVALSVAAEAVLGLASSLGAAAVSVSVTGLVSVLKGGTAKDLAGQAND